MVQDDTTETKNIMNLNNIVKYCMSISTIY